MTLRAVKPGESVVEQPAVPESISEAVEGGTGRDVLASMRRALARKLDNDEISSNAIASAYKELRELDRLIRSADAEQAVEEARKRADRNSGRRSFNAAAI